MPNGTWFAPRISRGRQFGSLDRPVEAFAVSHFSRSYPYLEREGEFGRGKQDRTQEPCCQRLAEGLARLPVSAMTRSPEPTAYLTSSNGADGDMYGAKGPSQSPLFALELDRSDYLRRVLAMVSCSLRMGVSDAGGNGSAVHGHRRHPLHREADAGAAREPSWSFSTWTRGRCRRTQGEYKAQTTRPYSSAPSRRSAENPANH